MPLTVSRKVLLDDGTDQRFRQLVYDLLTLSVRMNAVREHLARRMGLSGPQYSLLIAVGQLQGRLGVSVTALAKMLHVSNAFVATETGKLTLSGLLKKQANPKDRRGVLINLSRAGRVLIERNRVEICAVNDLFFGSLDSLAFEAMSQAGATLVHSSGKVMNRLKLMEQDKSVVLREAAE